MVYKRYSGFRYTLRPDLGNIDEWAEIFTKSPSKYNYYITKEEQANRKKKSNIIMDVTSSVSAEAILEFLKVPQFRLIFQLSLPMIKETDYRCYKSTEGNKEENEEKKKTYKDKINQLEVLAKMIEKA